VCYLKNFFSAAVLTFFLCVEITSHADTGPSIVLGDSLIADPPILAASQRQLEAAIMTGSLDDVRKAIADGVSINLSGKQGITPLILAISRDNVYILSALLKAGADFNARLDCGTPAIWFAATREVPGSLRMLLEAGADPNAIDEGRHQSPLFGALRSHNLENVRLLIGARANIDYQNFNGFTAPMIAVGLGEFEIACYLVESGANVRLKTTRGSTLLDLALKRKVGNQEGAKLARARLLALLGGTEGRAEIH
jgi:ankyrin repeat protein